MMEVGAWVLRVLAFFTFLCFGVGLVVIEREVEGGQGRAGPGEGISVC